MTLAEGYELRVGAPAVTDYVRLRRDAGLTPRTPEQAAAAIPGSWRVCHVVETARGTTVGMGRLIGDGGWYFHVVDMAVDPGHQRRGIGDAILTWLLAEIRRAAPPGAYVSLMGDEPGRPLYRKHGFVESERSVGMMRWVGGERDHSATSAAGF